jgi:excinuclease ABC subunit A
MRLLFARVGIPYSPATGLPIESQTVSQMVDRVMALEEGTRLYLLAPIVRGRKGEYRKELAELMKQGFQRVKVDGTFYEIADVPPLDKKYKHDIDVVVDRIVVRDDIAARLADSLRDRAETADGLAIAEFADKPLPKRKPQGRQRQQVERNPRAHRLLGEVRLPGLRLHHPKSSRGCFRSTTRSAPARPATASAPSLRFEATGGAGQDAVAAPGRHRALGEDRQHLALLHADAGGARQALQGGMNAVERPADEGADAILHGTGETEIDLRL